MRRILLVGLFCAATAGLGAPGGNRIVLMVEDAVERHIAVMGPEEEAPRLLTRGENWHLYPDIDGSGTLVTYVEVDPKTSASTVWLHPLDGREPRAAAQHDGLLLHPDLSGDGRRLAFSGPLGPDGLQQIAWLDLATPETERRPQVVATEHTAYFPAFSSDGAFLVFQMNAAEDDKRILRYDLETRKMDALTEEGGIAMAPALSFDDRAVAYTRKVEGNWDVYVTDLLTRETVRITSAAAQDFAPAFTPEGGIVFASDRDGHFQLYRISAESIAKKTFEVVPLLTGDKSYYAPAVSGEIAFAQEMRAEILPPARSSFGALRIRNRLYVVGGHQGREHTYPPESFLSNVEYYDLDTKTWHQAAPRPTPCHGFELAAHGKWLYAFGGFAYSADHKPAWKSLDVVERYDTVEDRWELVGRMPRRRSSNVVVTLDRKAYLIGGWDSTPKKENDYEGHFHREIDVFDFESNTFTTLPQGIPDPLRRAFSAELWGEEIILIGGLGVGATHFELLDHVTALNPRTGTWRELPRLPFATFAPAAGILDDSLFVFGGMFKTGPMDYRYVNHVYELPRAGAWRHTGRYLSESKGFAQVVPMGQRELAILGGHSYEGGDAPVPTFEVFGK